MDEEVKLTEHLLSNYEKETENQTGSRNKRSWQLPLISVLCGLLPAFAVWLAMSQSSQGSEVNRRLYHTSVPDCRSSPSKGNLTCICLTHLEVPSEMRVFEWNYTFAGVRSRESERAWRSLLPVSLFNSHFE